MATIREVIRPANIEGVLPILADSKRNPQVIAGGTDLLLQYQHRAGPDLTVVDIAGVPGLGEIVEEDGGVRIGAAVRLVDIVESETIAARMPVLVEGAIVVAGPQIRNLATIGGNVCNASPSADTITPLLILDATAQIRSLAGSRVVPLRDFFIGPGQTVLAPGELLESLLIPWPAPGAEALYTKLSPRRAMDLAVVGVAVALWQTDSGLRTRIGLGAVAPTPLRATSAEDVVNGAAAVDAELAAEAGGLAAAGISPIDDVRGSAGYRKKMVGRLVTRALLELGERLTHATGVR